MVRWQRAVMWQRGLFRVWLALSVLWVIAISVLGLLEIQASAGPTFLVAVIPPLAFLVLAVILGFVVERIVIPVGAWIFHGFRHD